ncbi:MAG: hypothetical protein RL380_765 [Verrucomicrobiota bacterium]|jgi:hypothetical protein
MKLSTRRVVGFFLALLLVGCASTPSINWDARVGNYSRDQAIGELGPPDREAALSDGSMVGEWLLQRGRTQTFVSPGYTYWTPHGYVNGGGNYVDSAMLPDYFLRLTFGSEGRLRAWKKFAR